MKNLIILILIAIIIIFTGVFTVDMRQTAVVTNYFKRQQVYSSGIYFAIPGLTNITYVYMNERNSILTIPVQFTKESGADGQLGILVNWHVTQPIIYLNSITQLTDMGLNKELVMALENIVQNETTLYALTSFNQKTSLIDAPINLDKLGISIDNVTIQELKTMPKVMATLPIKESEITHLTVAQSAIESAYYTQKSH